MTTQVFATTIGMSQTWSKSGKRFAICRLKMEDAVVVGKKTSEKDHYQALQIAFGKKKLANMTKPLRTIIAKSGFSLGRRFIREVKLKNDQDYATTEVGKVIPFTDIVQVGDIVNVQGTSKGRGFAGGMKRHGFHGSQRTHGQSDRERAPGSIGSGTTPGRVYKGKRMAGHYGVETKTVKNLQVIFIDSDTKELWVSGPVPGHINSMVRLSVTGHKEFEGLKEKKVTKASAEKVEVKDEKIIEKKEEVTKPQVTEEVKTEKVEKK
jgi:large subunit ribosomal protein L3